MTEIQIGDRLIGEAHPPFVIAEVGINHEGNYDKAIQMVDVAVAAGADCVKFQCHITEAQIVPTAMKHGHNSAEKIWENIKSTARIVTINAIHFVLSIHNIISTLFKYISHYCNLRLITN